MVVVVSSALVEIDVWASVAVGATGVAVSETDQWWWWLFQCLGESEYGRVCSESRTVFDWDTVPEIGVTDNTNKAMRRRTCWKMKQKKSVILHSE